MLGSINLPAIRTYWHHAVLWMSCFAVSGCVGMGMGMRADTPTEMQTIEKDCSSISGTYENQGIYYYDNGDKSEPRLADMIFDPIWGDRKLNDADFVNITITKDGILEISVFTNGEQVRTQRYSEGKGEYHCDHGTIQFTGWRGKFYLLIAHVARVSIAISRSINGPLIVNHTRTDAGYILGFPAEGTVTSWSHFSPREVMKPKQPLEPGPAQVPQ